MLSFCVRPLCELPGHSKAVLFESHHQKKKNDELVLTFGSFFYFLKINRTIILDSDYSSTSRLYVSTRAFRKANGGLRNNSDFLEKYSNNPFLCFLFPKKAIREALHVV